MGEAQRYPKRLIEVDLPIREISAHARAEKSARSGHLDSLHIWWARRPLAACRAVIAASLWPDPVDNLCPQEFRDGAMAALREFAAKARADRALAELCPAQSPSWHAHTAAAEAPEHLQQSLLDFISDFANFDASTNAQFLKAARSITRLAHRSARLDGSTAPMVHDPFSGGGAMPLEALRIGADTVASDLNPVAALLERVALDYVPRFSDRLVTALRDWGGRLKSRLSDDLAPLFPRETDGALPIAYLWARTIRCEAPACGVVVPILMRTLLFRKRREEVGLKISYSGTTLSTEVIYGQRALQESGVGTNRRSSVTCPKCRFTTSRKSVERQANDTGFGLHLFAVCTESAAGLRQFRQPSDADRQGVERARVVLGELLSSAPARGLSLVPDEELSYLRSIFNVRVYGIDKWSKLFTDRQLLCAALMVRAVERLRDEMAAEVSDEGLRRALLASLSLSVSNTLQYMTTITTRHPERIGFLSTFIQGQSLPMKMDFAEVNPLVRDLAGGFEFTLAQHISGIEYLAKCDLKPATVLRESALTGILPDASCDLVATDPPYYDMIPYADCSDFFYVWLRRMLRDDLGGESQDPLVPKADEIVQLAERNERYAHKTKTWFEARMRDALSNARLSLRADGLAVIVFAHKETAAWEALLRSVLDAGWTVTASWPIDTENPYRMRASESAVLSSSIHIVCRARTSDEVGAWRSVLAELPLRIHQWMPRLAREGIVGADAIFACLGPALEVFSRYSRVEKASGDVVALEEYLEQVWAAVAREALLTMFNGADASGLEEDARLSAMWLWTLGAGYREGATPNDELAGTRDDAANGEDDETAKDRAPSGFALEYDAARKIAQGLGARLGELQHVVEVKGDRARLLAVAERTQYLFGKTERATTAKEAAKKKQMALFDDIQQAAEAHGWAEIGAPSVGRTTLDRVHQAMLLFGSGRGEALKRFLIEEGVGNQAQFWKLAQSFSALYPAGSDEKRWVDGVLARKKGLGFG